MEIGRQQTMQHKHDINHIIISLKKRMAYSTSYFLIISLQKHLNLQRIIGTWQTTNRVTQTIKNYMNHIIIS
jgi:hypothetical protein